jgi:hypothetical protein
VTSHKVSSSFRFAARSCLFYYSQSLSPHGPPGSCDACTRPSTCNTICCTLHPIFRAAFYSVVALHRLPCILLFSTHGRHPALYPLGCMPVTNRRRQRAVLTESAPHMWGGTRGLREILPHLTSTYITRDIARCRPLALHYRCMKLKGPSNGLNGAQPAARQTFVVLTDRQRHAHHGRPLMTALTRGLPSFPITSQSHPTSPDCVAWRHCIWPVHPSLSRVPSTHTSDFLFAYLSPPTPFTFLLCGITAS